MSNTGVDPVPRRRWPDLFLRSSLVTAIVLALAGLVVLTVDELDGGELVATAVVVVLGAIYSLRGAGRTPKNAGVEEQADEDDPSPSQEAKTAQQGQPTGEEPKVPEAAPRRPGTSGPAGGTEVRARYLEEETPQSLPAPEPHGSQADEAIPRALVMAQRMADQTVNDAKSKAEAMVREAEAMVSEAEARSRSMTEQAQIRAREITETAQMRAREITEAAQIRARALTEGFEARHQERILSADARARVAEEQARLQIAQATEQVARRRQELESSIEALRAFERDYRARLRGFVAGQLKSIDQGMDIDQRAKRIDHQVKAIEQQVEVIEQQVEAIEDSEEVVSPEVVAASLAALKTLVVNYVTLIRNFEQDQLSALESAVPTNVLTPPQPGRSPAPDTDPDASTGEERPPSEA
jgi:cell division septum initiation protein DivIVA